MTPSTIVRGVKGALGARSSAAASLVLAAIVACVPPDEQLSSPDQQSPPPSEMRTASGGHTPLTQVVSWVVRGYYPQTWTMSFTEIDRDQLITMNWWDNGTPYPSRFRLTARYSDGHSVASELAEYPILAVPYRPGYDAFDLEVDHESEAINVKIKLIIEQPILPTELGGCDDRIRDLFLSWVKLQKDWSQLWWVSDMAELLPNTVSVLTCQGLCYQTVFYLRASMIGSAGPILAVDDVTLNPYSGPLTKRMLLFFNDDGTLRETVDGQPLFVLPEGNLFVSGGMANSSVFNPSEWVQVVTPDGDVLWDRFIGGIPPGTLATTLAGNVAMPWERYDETDRRGGLPVFNPSTGVDVVDDFVDRSALCTTASIEPDCQAGRATVQASFDAWWLANRFSYAPVPNGPHAVCDRYSCFVGSLVGWLRAHDEDVLEIKVDVINLGGEFPQKASHRLVFVSATDRAARGVIGGAFIRRLASGDLLISTAYAPWLTQSQLESSGENFAAVGPAAAVRWRRPADGPPALLQVRNRTYGSAGYLLANNRLLWATHSSLRNDKTELWIDLVTGARKPAPKRRVYDGMCEPRL